MGRSLILRSTLLVALGACAELSDEELRELEASETEQEVLQGEQAILNGTAAAAAAETEGIVLIRHWDNVGQALCTGTLIRNDLVLTALHCASPTASFSPPVDTNYANYTLTMGSQTASVVNAVAFPSADVALLQVNQFFTMNGSKYNYQREISTATPQQLPANLQCYGYGKNTAVGGSGTLRQGVLPLVAGDTSALILGPNASGQILMPGDSGGTCFHNGQATGVGSRYIDQNLDNVPEYVLLISHQAYRPWVFMESVARADAVIHTSSAANTSGAHTTLTHFAADDAPGALVQVTPNLLAGANNNAFIGVTYAGNRWRVSNLSGANMAVGSAYNVSVGGNSFLHTSATGNISGNRTVINHAATNNNPNALLFVTQSGTTNPRAVGVRYDGALGRWTIFNENNTAMPANAKFNVRVATPGDASFVHNTNAFNVLFNWTYLDHPLLNNQPDAQFFITHNANPGNGTVGPSVTSPLAASWDAASGKWTVVTQDLGGMPWGASFNILVRP